MVRICITSAGNLYSFSVMYTLNLLQHYVLSFSILFGMVDLQTMHAYPGKVRNITYNPIGRLYYVYNSSMVHIM